MRRKTIQLSLMGLLTFMGLLILAPVQNSVAQTSFDWTGLFFPAPDFSGASQVVTYTGSLSQNWGTGIPTNPSTQLPLPGIPADNFSARFTASVALPAGAYQISVVADGGVRISANGATLLDEISSAGLNTYTATVNVDGSQNIFVIDYVDYSGIASITVTIQAAGAIATTTPVDTTVRAVVAGVNGLALRTGPYLGASLVAVLRPGNQYVVTAQNNAEGTYPWYKIVANPAGQTGWASGRFLTVDLQSIESLSCNITADIALSIAQSRVPNFLDTNQAIICVNSALNTIENRSDGEYRTQDLVSTGNSCSTILLNNLSIENITNFVNSVESTLTSSGACDTESTPTLSVPEESTLFETLGDLPDTGARAYPRTIMNIRIRPSIRTPIIGQIPWGAEAQLLARTIEAGEDHWYLIRYAGIVGWIDASYVNASGNLADVPIY